MKPFYAVLLALTVTQATAASAQTLADRIGHTDPSRYRPGRSHGSVGDMNCMTLLPGNALTTNLYFLHRCQITPGGGGVGHHFHNTTEEMFVIFDGEAEFTIDGRTSLLRGTVGAPVRMGHSHAIYNPGTVPVEFICNWKVNTCPLPLNSGTRCHVTTARAGIAPLAGNVLK